LLSCSESKKFVKKVSEVKQYISTFQIEALRFIASSSKSKDK
jgi:hypothetical protein